VSAGPGGLPGQGISLEAWASTLTAGTL
jgi:hypothetical protein